MASDVPSRDPIPGAYREPLIPFGIDFIDAETGGLIRDKLYLLYGPLSAWKTCIALHFLFEGLRSDQRCVYVTSQDPEAVIFQADRLGFDLRPFLQDDRLTLLSYHPRISQHLALLPDYARVIQELHRLGGPQPFERLVFDPVEGLLSHDNQANLLPAARLLVEAIKALETTTLCLLDETDEPHIQALAKELIFLSFGAFHIELEDDARVFHFAKILWNPRDYLKVPLSLRSRQGVQVLEAVYEAGEEPHLSLAPPIDLNPAERGASPEKGRPIELLLADDDDNYFEMLKEYLEPRYHVEQVRDSVEAISRLLERSYDVILVNLNMPRVDGREVCLRIRQHQSAVPLITYSNRLKRGSDAASVLRLGADAFVSRPLSFNHLQAAIEAVLRRPAGPESFARPRELIRLIQEEQRALRGIPRTDPGTGLSTEAYFDQKVSWELEKAKVGEYSFSLVGYHFETLERGLDLEPVLWRIFPTLIRTEDLVYRQAPGAYVLFLEECLGPGVRRINDRLRKALNAETGGKTFTFQYQVATFPADGTSLESLTRAALTPKRPVALPHLKRVP